MQKCSSGKVVYLSEMLAEDALVDSWIRNQYQSGQGPISIYQCDDCGNFHFTSKGEMNVRLKNLLDNGYIARNRRALELETKLRKK